MSFRGMPRRKLLRLLQWIGQRNRDTSAAIDRECFWWESHTRVHCIRTWVRRVSWLGIFSGSGISHRCSDEAIPPPVLGGRETARLEWTGEGPTGIIKGLTRGDVRHLQALHGASLVVQGLEMETASEDPVFITAHDT